MLDRKLIALPVAGLLALALVAAGATGATRKTQKLRLSADADGGLTFTKKRLVARHAGRITLVLKNPSSSGLSHGIGVKGHNGKAVDPGGTSRVTVRLKKGRYTFYCPVDGHRAAGMKGTLVVR